MRVLKLLCVLSGLLATSSFSLQAAIIDSVNPDGMPQQVGDNGWNIENIGWLYTPTFDYTLQGVNTLFGTDTRQALPQIVTLEIFDEVGGNVLRSADFMALENTYSGALFADLTLVAGEDYFIGFRNIMNLQANFNVDGIAPTELTAFYNFAGAPDYGSQVNSGPIAQALLQFEGQRVPVPEPSSLILLLAGILGFAASRRKLI